MLCKLAWGNVRRAGRDYLVYLLTLTLAVTVFYAFNTISIQIDYAAIDEEGLSDLLGGIMGGLTVFLAVVMGFLMVYANNFIMKRRKKEFGLYQVLGMSRAQVACVMALETVIVSGVALALGLALGVALSQVMTFFTASLFRTQIADFHFFFSFDALLITVCCLAATFLVTLVFNLRVVARAKVIDLMSASRRNELVKTRNPWLSAAIFAVAVAAVAVSYARLLHDGFPLDGTGAEMQAFLITTLMVVVGTVLLFFGLSGFLLQVLSRARGLYWRGLNMFTLRQLSAKVNTVSLSMAVIAMVLFLAITSVTTGMSLATVMTENVERHTPVDYSRVVIYYSPESAERANASAEEYGEEERYAAPSEPVDVMAQAARDQYADGTTFDPSVVTGAFCQVDLYDARPARSSEPLLTLADLIDAVGGEMPKGVNELGNNALQVMCESDFNRLMAFRGLDPVHLGERGYTLLCDMGSSITDIYGAMLREGRAIDFGGVELSPVQAELDTVASVLCNSQMGSNTGTIVVPDELADDNGLLPYESFLLVNYPEDKSVEECDAYLAKTREYSEVEADDGSYVGFWGMEITRTESFASMDTLNGLISYLAIYIGFVLVVACAAILAVQQLSGVADSGENCRILSELGTARQEIMRSVAVQQAVFFLFPLAVGAAHSLVAVKVVVELVELFGGFSIASTVGFTTAIFLAAYGGYFLVTYLMSRGIIRDAIRARHAA